MACHLTAEKKYVSHYLIDIQYMTHTYSTVVAPEVNPFLSSSAQIATKLQEFDEIQKLITYNVFVGHQILDLIGLG